MSDPEKEQPEIDPLLAAKRETLVALGYAEDKAAKLNSVEACDARIESLRELRAAKPAEAPKTNEEPKVKFLKPSRANTPPLPKEDPVRENEQKPDELGTYLSPMTARNGLKFNTSARVARLFTREYPDGRMI